MNSMINEKRTRVLDRARYFALVASTAFLLGGAGCIGGFNNENLSEGDRCNPLDFHDECASGMVCTGQGTSATIPFCPENYCCAVDANGNINSTNPNCQPGCNGGAAAICTADKDPGACNFADSGVLE